MNYLPEPFPQCDKGGVTVTPHFTDRDTGTEKFSHLPRIPRLVSDRAWRGLEEKTQAEWSVNVSYCWIIVMIITIISSRNGSRSVLSLNLTAGRSRWTGQSGRDQASSGFISVFLQGALGLISSPFPQALAPCRWGSWDNSWI